MSDPTYRIDVEHEPGESGFQWMARIIRLSDEAHVKSRAAQSAEDAVVQARRWIAETATKQPGFSLLVDDDGRPVEGMTTLAEEQDVDVNYYVLVPFTSVTAAEWAAGEIGAKFDCHVVGADAVDQEAPILASVSYED